MGGIYRGFMLLAIVVTACHLGACTNSGTRINAYLPNQPAVPAFEGLLPPPSALAGWKELPRRSSYTEDGLIRHGKEYEGSLPNRNVSIVGETASFEPAWSDGSSVDPAGLAFCTFLFAADGFDRQPQVRYGWEIAPAQEAKTYLGLANWSEDCWEWFVLGPAGFRPFASFEQYLGLTGALMAVVVQTGTEICRLRYLRLGPQQLFATLSAVPARGVVPLEVTLTAQGSYSLAGNIVEAVWDFEGDGSLDVSSGALLEKDHTYDPPGEWYPRVQITSEYGVQAYASAAVNADEPWERVWGLDGRGIAGGMATDGESAVYVVGRQEVGDEDDDLLLLKYGLDGDFEWARMWGSTGYDYGTDVAVSGSGDLYVTGGTYSFGEGLTDLLLQRWDSGGNLIWTRTWGGEGTDVGYGVALIGDDVFVAGRTDSFDGGTGKVLLLAYDPDGEVAWQRAVGGDGQDIGFDIAAWQHPSTQARKLYIAGTAHSFNAMGQALYARFNGDGDLVKFDTWEASYRSSAISIALALVIPSTRIFLAGETYGSSQDALLLEAGTGVVTATSWDSGLTDVAFELTISGGKLVAAGLTQVNTDNQDGLLLGYSLAFDPEFAYAWDVTEMGLDAKFEALAPYPNSGVLLGGQYPNLSGTWLPRPTDSALLSGAWVDRQGAVTVLTPAGVNSEQSMAATEVTNGDETGATIGPNTVLLAHPAT